MTQQVFRDLLREKQPRPLPHRFRSNERWVRLGSVQRENGHS